MRSILKKTLTSLFMTIIIIQCIILLSDKMNVEALATMAGSEDIIIEDLNESGILELDFDDNKTKTLNIDSGEAQIIGCSNWGGRGIFTADYDYDNGKCTLTAKHFGIERLNLTFSDSTANENIEKYVLVDVETDKYLNAALDKMPDEYYGSQYNTGEVSNYANKYLFNDINYEMDNSACVLDGKNYNCTLKLKYWYTTLDNESDVIEVSKPITLIQYTLPELATYELQINETREIGLNLDNDINTDDLVFVSLDNSVASVTKSGKITANGYGETEIRLYNKKTFEYTSGKVIVKEVKYNSIDEMLEDFNNTLTIDANTLEYSWISYQEIAMQHFRELAAYLSSYQYASPDYSTTTCEENVCIVGYYYNGQQYTTEPITINIEGINAPDKIYIMKNQTFDINNYVKSYTGGDIALKADENYIKWITGENCEYQTVCDEEGNCTSEPYNCEEYGYYQTQQIGEVEVEFIVDGYIKKSTIVITHEWADEDSVRNQFNNIDSITLPYSSLDFANNLNYLSNIVKSNIKSSISNENLDKYMKYNVTCLFVDKCTVNIDATINESNNYTQLLYISPKTIKINYSGLSSENSAVINELKRVNEQLEDEYLLSFRDTLILENTYISDDEFYANLISKTDINNIITSSSLDITLEQVETKLFTNTIKGGTVYKLTFKDNDVILDEREITVTSNHIYYMDGFMSQDDEKRIDCIKDQVDAVLSSDATVTKVIDNVYEVDLGTKKFNIIFDQKEIIKISYIGLNETAVELNSGDTYQIDYSVYPTMANTGTITFDSSDESIATVDENGLVTAIKDGYTTIKVRVGYSTCTLLVAVNTKIEDMLNSVLEELPNHVTVNYSSLNYSNLSNAIANTIYSSLYNLTSNNLMINLEVVEENEKQYLTLKYYKGYGKYINSDSKEITYDLKGIKIKSNEIEIASNESYDLEVFFSEGDISNIYYEVQDKSIATISSTGVIKGLKPGITYINIYDKYNQYYNCVKVIVDKDLFYDTKMTELKSSPVVINGDTYTTYSTWYDGTNIINNMFQSELYKHISMYDYADGIQTICNTNTMKCTMYLTNYENGYVTETWTEEFDIEFDGIFVSNAELELNSDVEEKLQYEVYPNDAEVKIESLNTNLCEITSDNKVKTLATGICPIKYTTEGHTTYQFVIINETEIIENLQSSYDNVTSPIDIKTEKYDENVTEMYNSNNDYEGSAEYVGIYDATITNHIESQMNIPYEYWYSFSLDDLNENDELDVSIDLYYSFRDQDIDYYYSYDFEDNLTRTFKLTYGEVPVEEKTIGELVKENIKTNYDLTLTQALKFQMSTDKDDFEEIYKYSSLSDDIKEICSDCTFVTAKTVGGAGGGEDSAGMSTAVVVYKNGYPITSKFVNFTIYFNVEVGVQNSFDDIIEIIEDEVKSAYLQVKNSLLTQATPLMTRGNSIFAPITTASNDIDVEVTKESTDETGKGTYSIKVEDIKFKAVIDTTVTGEINYSNKVTGIKTNVNTLNLKVGQSSTIKYEITPNNATDKSVTWTSSDTNVATVTNNGEIIAKSIGKATVTVKTNDGGYKATVTVNVTLDDSQTTKLGDVNLDNLVNMNDLITLRKQQAGLVVFNDKALANADMNNDSRVNMTDIIQLRKYLAK